MKQTRRQRLKTWSLAALIVVCLGCPAAGLAAQVMCLKTNTGQYIEVARVSMMVVPDGGSTFEIVVKDGDGAVGVESISFEKHESDIDLSKYQGNPAQGGQIDTSKPVFLLTSTGKYYYMKELPVMTAQEGSDKFDVTVGDTTERNVSFVYFYRGTEESLGHMTAIGQVKADGEERLRLQTPVSSQMQISGCGAATSAVVYATDGRQVAESVVTNGVTTIYVGHLTSGIYIVKTGNKSLKFVKK